MMNPQIEHFLLQLSAMPRDERMHWMTVQSAESRLVIAQHIQAQQAELLGQQWQLGRSKRVLHAKQTEAMSALDRLAVVRQLVIAQLTEQFHDIYVNGNAALQNIWILACDSVEEAQRTLIQMPETFGELRGISVLGGMVSSPARRRAKQAVKALDFIKLWDSYSQLEFLQQQLQQTMEATRHARH